MYGVRRIGAPGFWSLHGLGGFPAGGSVAVGIVDTGVDGAHEDLAGRVTGCGAASDGRVSDGGPISQTLAAAAKTAYGRGGRAGSLIVAAAGNDGDTTVSYPAGLPQVVSVAAIGPTDAVAPFSNENADVELAAAGVDVLSARRGGGYA